MKTKLITRLFPTVAILVFLAIFAGNAFAITNKTSVISPYWQSDDSTGVPSYTFIAVSHTSLSGLPSQIGVKVTAVRSEGTESTTDDDVFGSAVTFTLSQGETRRVFILRSTLGSGTTNILGIDDTSTSDDVEVIIGDADNDTGFQHGHVLIEPDSSTPNTRTTGGAGNGWPDITLLSYWGAVVIEQNTTGFAMEFIGDMHDSTIAKCVRQVTNVTTAQACVSAGVATP